MTYAFSKKLTNLAAAFALHAAYYNFCWRMRENEGGKQRPTPAMQAGLVDTLWTMEDLFDAVEKHQADKKQQARIENLLRKLRSAND